MGNVCQIAGLENRNGARPTRAVAEQASISLSLIPSGCVNGYADLGTPAAA
jgi:hypothetical protein